MFNLHLLHLINNTYSGYFQPIFCLYNFEVRTIVVLWTYKISGRVQWAYVVIPRSFFTVWVIARPSSVLLSGPGFKILETRRAAAVLVHRSTSFLCHVVLSCSGGNDYGTHKFVNDSKQFRMRLKLIEGGTH